MRRAAVIAALIAALAGASVAHAQAPIKLATKVSECHTGVTPDQRFADFVGQMPALPGTKRMAMRFDLYQRIGDAGFQKIAVPKFGVWQRSQASQSGFIFDKRVDQLVAPASYRVLVTFKWYDAHNKVQRTTTRISASCAQPDSRPNLTVGKVQGSSGVQPGTIDYAITMHNEGLGDAGTFNVLLTVNGMAQPEQAVAGLAARSKSVVTVTAPTCTPGSTITIQLDPENVIAESDEADDSFTRNCP